LVNKLLVTIFEYICARRNQGISYSLCPKRKWKFLPKRPVLNLSFASFKCFKMFDKFTKHFFHFLEESSWSHIWMIVIYSRPIIGHKLRPGDLRLHLSRAATSFLWAVITYICAAILISKLFFKGSSLFAGPCKYLILMSSCQVYTKRTRLWNWILEKSSIQHSWLN